MEPRPWQAVVLDYIASPVVDLPISNYERNMEYGLVIKMPRRSGHTSLAQEILRRFPDAVVCVPSDRMPRANLQRYQAALGPELSKRVIVCAPQEAGGKLEIIEKSIEPLKSARILVIDDASMLSNWELNTLRCANWDKYVELG